MNIAICDDDIISVDYLSALCRDIALVDSVVAYTAPDALLAAIHEGSPFDVIIMDIDFETQKNGIDYTEKIYHINPLIRTIYITGYTERFVQNIFLKEAALIGFITKPAPKKLLEELLCKAQKQIDSDRSNLLCVLGKGTMQAIPCNTITYLESTGHKVLIHTEKEAAVYSVYERLASVAEKLPSSFLQCHKSYCINMDKIKRIEKREIYLFDNSCIQISKSHAATVKERYMQYIQQML